jgi:hypothetical protein
MKPSALLLAVAVALALAGPAAAQTPKPHATGFFTGPSGRATPHPLHGRACNGPIMAQRAQTAVNPINGQAQAAPIVSIPLTKNGGGTANATSRAQQAQACAHTR